jgi:glycosyltransferase involved in cell wall biosynthesis
MNVLHVISSIDPRSGGPAEALRGLAAAQAAAGLRVALVATWTRHAPDTAFAEQLRERGVEVHLVGPCRGPLKWHRDLKPILRRAAEGSDVLHVHGLWEEVQHRAAREARRAGRPYVFRPCGMLDPWSLSQGRLRKALYLRWRLRADLDGAAALHFTSPTEADLTRPLALRAPALVEPNGIDLDEFDRLPAPGTFRSRHVISPGTPLVLFLSRLHPKKGLDLLLPALANCGVADAVLAVAGPDESGMRLGLEAEANRLGLSGRVFFTGMLRGQEKAAALVDADLFVLPSYQENFGVAVVEALAAGTPVVVSDQVNIHADIHAAGVGGVVPTAVAPLAAELARWLTDAGLRRDAAARAPAFVRRRYSWNEIAARWAAHYRRLAGAVTTAGAAPGSPPAPPG